MVRLLRAALLGVLAFAIASHAQKAECGEGLGKCPSDKPCCSQYGQCGVGAFCLGGCDPVFSFKLQSCVPAPICQSKKHTFEGLKNVVDKTKYLGDASKADWVADGNPMNQGDNLLLTMEPHTVGTVLASAAYVWYGKISAVLKTSRGRGVVSAFILLSDVKDEIDFEWIGVDLDTTQTNYYWQGFPDYNNAFNLTDAKDTFDDYHTYEVDWTPEQISWSIDGKVGRVVKKADTLNTTTKVYHYPQTPARVQLSLWPGGLASNAEGTILWSGGLIDWVNAPDIKDPGYYYATFKEVTVECYDPPSDAVVQGSKSYRYNNVAGMENNVVISDSDTVLKSFLGTGTNMTAVLPKASKSSSGSKPSSTDSVETVPGLTGAGTGADSLRGSDSSGGGGSSGSDSGSDGSGGGAGKGGSNTFSQGDTSSKNGNSGNSGAAVGNVVRGSVLAIVVAFAGIMVL